MNFSKELSLIIIKNIAFIDGGAVEAVQTAVFKAINARLEKRIKALGGWKGRYELITGAADETAFAPAAWPESQDGKYRVCYKLTAMLTDENTYWLSSALGVNCCKLCLRLWVHGALGGRSKGEIERKMLMVGTTDAARAAGMVVDTDNTVYLPFVFFPETLVTEYPTVEKTLAPLDAAVDKLLQVNPLIDAAVQELAAKR